MFTAKCTGSTETRGYISNTNLPSHCLVLIRYHKIVMPDLIRHPEIMHNINWITVFTGMTTDIRLSVQKLLRVVFLRRSYAGKKN